MTDKTFKFNKANHTYTLDGQRMYGVTTILGVISKGDALINWAANMAVDYVKSNSIKDVRDENPVWIVTDSALQDARTAHTKRKEEAGAKGTSLHSWVEQFIKAEIRRSLVER